MRYIKPFNENVNVNNFKEELRDFCETSLAYLMDDGGKVNITHIFGKDDNAVYIHLEEPKTWHEIKDQVMPFLIRLIRKYNVKGESSTHYNTYHDIRFYLSGRHYDSVLKRVDYNIQGIIDNEEEWSRKNLLTTCDIKTLRFVVDGYKQEPQPKKKSFISKIKNYFK
jgi:hypothetical protein